MKAEYDIQQIMALLPHRYPFLLIDRVMELKPDDRIIALKNVTINEPFFQGHFPVQPIMPGVLIIEAMAQAGGLLAYESGTVDNHGKLIYFMGMDKVRFRKPVVPGDQLIFEAKILKLRTKAAKMAGRASVDNQIVAEAELMASFGERK
ncbi:MAG: 3-hydroxyacyl-ACP dehydratase FabZ [Desulfobacterales bacterium]|jgi:beta-hydroxyacyl-ACP dehydratase FabZ